MNLQLDAMPHDQQGLTITTECGLKMTDYGVKPPTAMFGVIKSGDAISVKIKWELKVGRQNAAK